MQGHSIVVYLLYGTYRQKYRTIILQIHARGGYVLLNSLEGSSDRPANNSTQRGSRRPPGLALPEIGCQLLLPDALDLAICVERDGLPLEIYLVKIFLKLTL